MIIFIISPSYFLSNNKKENAYLLKGWVGLRLIFSADPAVSVGAAKIQQLGIVVVVTILIGPSYI